MRRSTDPLRGVKRGLHSFTFIVLLSSVANAYTIVMLGGRHIQIPDQFTVTETNLTYRVGATISATILMAAIDVTATERANNEEPGSLLKRPVDRTRLSAQRVSSDHRSGGRLTITNDNLERYAQARRASEAAYEKRRIELGLPSLDESRRKAAEDEESLARLLVETRVREQQTESYWQARASELRSDLAALDAQINFVRERLGESPGNPATGPLVIGAFSWTARSRNNPSLSPNLGPRPNSFLSPAARGHFAYPGTAGRGRAFTSPMTSGSARRFVQPFPLVALPPDYDFPYEGSALGAELDRLLAVRAGLAFRMRELEDEARRAGVDPGWLRP